MVVRRVKKSRKFRGYKTHGYGSKKKHRGKGSKGGKGLAGKFKQKKTWFLKYKPEEMKTRGFNVPHKEQRALNVRELDRIVSALMREKKAKEVGGKVIVNLKELGYDKIIGAGNITIPVIISSVSSLTKSAKEKIEKAGGRILGNDAEPA